jgi:hypothetical protein
MLLCFDASVRIRTDLHDRKLLNKRALMCLAWIALVDAALCCLFILVPGKRL